MTTRRIRITVIQSESDESTLDLREYLQTRLYRSVVDPSGDRWMTVIKRLFI